MFITHLLWQSQCQWERHSKEESYPFKVNTTRYFIPCKLHKTNLHWKEEGTAGQYLTRSFPRTVTWLTCAFSSEATWLIFDRLNLILWIWGSWLFYIPFSFKGIQNTSCILEIHTGLRICYLSSRWFMQGIRIELGDSLPSSSREKLALVALRMIPGILSSMKIFEIPTPSSSVSKCKLWWRKRATTDKGELKGRLGINSYSWYHFGFFCSYRDNKRIVLTKCCSVHRVLIVLRNAFQHCILQAVHSNKKKISRRIWKQLYLGFIKGKALSY